PLELPGADERAARRGRRPAPPAHRDLGARRGLHRGLGHQQLRRGGRRRATRALRLAGRRRDAGWRARRLARRGLSRTPRGRRRRGGERPLRGGVPGVARARGTARVILLPTTPEFLRFQGRRRPPGGLFFAGRRIAYDELAAAVDALADWLARRGFGAGHAVAILAANEPAMVAMTYAVWGLGAVAVPIAVRSTAAETSRLLVHARARAVLADE